MNSLRSGDWSSRREQRLKSLAETELQPMFESRKCAGEESANRTHQVRRETQETNQQTNSQHNSYLNTQCCLWNQEVVAVWLLCLSPLLFVYKYLRRSRRRYIRGSKDQEIDISILGAPSYIVQPYVVNNALRSSVKEIVVLEGASLAVVVAKVLECCQEGGSFVEGVGHICSCDDARFLVGQIEIVGSVKIRSHRRCVPPQPRRCWSSPSDRLVGWLTPASVSGFAA